MVEDVLELSVFFADKWSGEIKAKESSLKEFRWFNKSKLPLEEMFPDNDKWMPKVFEDRLIRKIDGQYMEVKELN